MDLQEWTGWAERRERSVSNTPTISLGFLCHFVGYVTKNVMIMSYCFCVSAVKVYEEDHPLLIEHRKNELKFKQDLYE